MNNDFHTDDATSGLGSLLLALSLILLVLLVLLLSGCGAGDSSPPGVTVDPGPPAGMALLEGRAADGYLLDAEVFLDRNGNKLPDPDEPQTLTGSGGRFSLEVPAGQEQLYPVVVRVVQFRTRDEEEAVTAPYEYLLETPLGRHGFISPLTTLVKQELDKNGLFHENDAVNLIRARFGLSAEFSPWQDYLSGEQNGPDSAAWQQAHEAARILAALQGRLLESIRQNLGGLQESDYLPASRLIGDLQMQLAQEIANSVTGISPAAARSKDQLVDQLLTEIDLGGLDRQLLSRYRQLIDKQPDSWDATAPTIIARQPAAGTGMPVTGSIELAFSEALDPATLQSDAVVLRQGDNIIKGAISYDKNRFLLTMVPFQPLQAYSDYMVEVAPAITDQPGNPLGQVPGWQVSTLFEHSPPALPEF